MVPQGCQNSALFDAGALFWEKTEHRQTGTIFGRGHQNSALLFAKAIVFQSAGLTYADHAALNTWLGKQ